jgi:ATP-dependent protease ClpP protease subunit
MANASPSQATPPPTPPSSQPNNIFWRRPRRERSIDVFGPFTDELGQKLLSEIAAYRAVNNDDITVYINSNGGSVQVLKFINGLLDCQDLDQNFCSTISVALGMAASAGAILLTYGDYAYAYPHSIIHFHAIRTSELPETFEDAADVLGGMDATQTELSRKLARKVIGRVMFRYQGLKRKFKQKRVNPPDKNLMNLRRFLDEVEKHISPRARHLVQTTYQNVVKARTLTMDILPKAARKKSRSEARSDAKLLIGVIKHEIAEFEKEQRRWRIDETGAYQIVSDYLAIRDYMYGDHNEFLAGLIRSFGKVFLSPSENKQHNELRAKDEKKAFDWLLNHTLARIDPLWYYTVSLCRTLFKGENRLTAKDAYWMGIIDEVIGTNCMGYRVVAEDSMKSRAKVPNSVPAPAQSGGLPAGGPA